MILHFLTTSHRWPYQYHLAFCSGVLVHKPDRAIIWYTGDKPKGQYWLATEKFMVTAACSCDLMKYTFGILPDDTYIIKDCSELDILYQNGGLFMDLDTLSVQKIEMDPDKELYAPPETTDLKYFNNAVLGCQKHSALMHDLTREANKRAMSGKAKFGDTGPELLNWFIPQHLDKTHTPPCGEAGNHPNWNYWNATGDVFPVVKVMHLYGASQPEFKKITSPEYVATVNNVFTRTVKKVLPEHVWRPKFYVEIGANSFETLQQKHCSDNQWTGIAVEAVEEYAEKPIPGHGVIVGTAICGGSGGDLHFEYIPKDSVGKEGVPGWAAGIGSLDPNLSHLRDLSKHVKGITVKGVNINEFLDSMGVTHIDFLKIDTEGLDAEILFALDINKFKPAEIYFEIKHLNPKDITGVRNKFNTWSFVINGDNATMKPGAMVAVKNVGICKGCENCCDGEIR